MTSKAGNLSLLGGFLLTVGGERRDVPARKVKALVGRLAVDDAPLSRGALAALLWPDSPPAAARHSLRQALSELRRSLENSTIGLTVTPQEAALETYDGAIDVREFRVLAASGDPQDWARAMSLYRGTLLEGLEVRVDCFEEWLHRIRHELEQTALGLCRKLAEHQEDEAEAIAWNRRLLALDPLDEAVHRDLMRLYIASDQDGAAIRQFLHCRSMLERELGIAPDAETRALYEGLLTHRSADRGRRSPEVRGEPGSAEAADVLSAGVASDGERLGVATSGAAGDAARRLRPAVVLTCQLAVDHADPERADTVRREQVVEVTRMIRSFGGRVVAEMGDHIVSGFGLGRMRGAEADRACLAGGELASAVPGLRAGIASGQVIYRQEERSLVGQAASQAQLLAAQAQPGEVKVSDEVAAARRYGVEGEGGELVGRTLEIRQFVALLDGSRDGGYGCALLVRGEAGIGKTRLVQEYTALARREGFAVHAAQCYDFGADRGRDAIAQLVGSLLGRDAASAGAVARRLGEEHVPYLQAVLGRDPSPQVAAQLDSQPPFERLRRTTAAVVALIRQTARDSALVLVVDDLHWADRLTLALLPRITRAAAELPVVVVMTSRVAGEALDPEWRAAMGSGPLTTMDLRPLRRPDAENLATALGAGEARLAELLERAGGNPLFIQQLVRSNGLGPAVPHSIQSLAVAQLESLPEPVQVAVRAASVLGQHFSLEAVEATAGVPVELEPALQAGLMARSEEQWRFHHALIRDGIYHNVLPSERRRLHARAGEHFRPISLSLHAQHLDRADAPEAVTALVEAAADEIDHYRLSRARQLVQRALERAPRDPGATLIEARLELMVGNTARAVAGFRACREEADTDEVRAHALVGLGMALNQLDDYEEAAQSLRDAVTLNRDDHAYQADAWLQLGNVLFPQGFTAECLRCQQTSLEHAGRAGCTLRQARAEGGLGDAYYQQGAMITAARHFDRCVELGETHGHAGVVPGHLAMRGLTRMYQNRFEEAVADGRRALALARQSSNLRHQLLAHNVLASLESFHGELEAGLVHARMTLALGQRIGSRRFVLDAHSQVAHLLWAAGRVDEARRTLEHAEQALDVSMLPFAGAYVRGLQAACAASEAERRARLAEGERLLDSNAVSHCHVFFYFAAMESSLVIGEAGQALRYAAALEAYTAAEALPFADFFIRRARVLAGEERAEARAELIAEARAAGLGAGLRLLDPGPELRDSAALPREETPR